MAVFASGSASQWVEDERARPTQLSGGQHQRVAIARALVGRPVVVLADSSVLVGFPAAQKYLGFDGHPSEVYLRAQTSQVGAVDSVLERRSEIGLRRALGATKGHIRAQFMAKAVLRAVLGGAVGVGAGAGAASTVGTTFANALEALVLENTASGTVAGFGDAGAQGSPATAKGLVLAGASAGAA